MGTCTYGRLRLGRLRAAALQTVVVWPSPCCVQLSRDVVRYLPFSECVHRTPLEGLFGGPLPAPVWSLFCARAGLRVRVEGHAWFERPCCTPSTGCTSQAHTRGRREAAFSPAYDQLLPWCSTTTLPSLFTRPSVTASRDPVIACRTVCQKLWPQNVG